MKELVDWLRLHPAISIRTVERALGLPNTSINLRKGYITPKHVNAVGEYLKGYGFEYVPKIELKGFTDKC